MTIINMVLGYSESSTSSYPAYPNSLTNVKDKEVVFSDGNLTLKTDNPVETENQIVSICENGFCITKNNSGLHYNIIDDNTVGEEVINSTWNTILSQNYDSVLGGLNNYQYHMNFNTTIVTQTMMGGYVSNLIRFGINDDSKNVLSMNTNDYRNIFSVCGDNYLYGINRNGFVIYRVSDSTEKYTEFFTIGHNDTGFIGYVHDSKLYLINYNTCEKRIINNPLESLTSINDGSVTINKIGLNIVGCQQTKDEKYILCKDGYITFDNDNNVIEEHLYPDAVTYAMGGQKVHHFQALYDGYYGFGMEDGRYILCWYDSVVNGIEDTFVRVFEPYFIENDSTIYHRFFSGYADYWFIPNIPYGKNVSSKMEIVNRENLYNISENNKNVNISNKNTTSGVLTGDIDGDKFIVNTLVPNEETLKIYASSNTQTFVIEGIN